MAWFLLSLGGFALIFIMAVFGGTVVWLIWPVVGKAFPALVAGGVLAPALGWWDAVSLTWLMGILIKSPSSAKNTVKKDKDEDTVKPPRKVN